MKTPVIETQDERYVMFEDYGLWDKIMLWFLLIMVALLFQGCMTIREAQMDVKAESGSTVNIGTKNVNIPVNATIPQTLPGF